MIISWNVTRKCNLRCRHCYRDAGEADPNELTTEEALRLVGQIAKAGFRILIFSGGEPLLREDIYELIAAAKAAGMRPVLGTNGTLIDLATARRLKNAGLARAGISIDSLSPTKHDEFRQAAGSWYRTIAALDACRSEELPFQIHTTVTRHNAGETDLLTMFAEETGAAAHHLFFLVPTGRGSAIADGAVDGPVYASLVREIAHRQKDSRIELKAVCAPQFAAYCARQGIATRFDRGCLAGISYCCILPGGEVHPCPYLPLSAGNVRTVPFDRLWQGNELFEELRTQRYKGRCGACAHRVACGGCRARAYRLQGDYMQEDPSCLFAEALPEAVPC
jgi:putative heme d1 biosynthesis radical SAM protein NirJ2